jgi:hypothetical protein
MFASENVPGGQSETLETKMEVEEQSTGEPLP